MGKNKAKTYSVKFSREIKLSISGSMEVSAKNEDQAKDKVKTLLDDDSGPGSEVDIYDTDVLYQQINVAIRLGNFDGEPTIDYANEIDEN